MSVHKSGAFLQQCFSVHPLSLNVKLVSPPHIVGVVCSNCRMRHRVTLRQVPVPPEDTIGIASQELFLLQKCVHDHPTDVRVSLVQVEHCAVTFRCGPCRRTYVLDVALFETHQS